MAGGLIWHQTQIGSYSEILKSQRGSEVFIYDRKGEQISSLRRDPRIRRLSWVSLPLVSPAFVQKLIAAEDKRFFSHHGVDFKALGSAMVDRVRTGNRGGASTLSMQVARLLSPNQRKRNYFDKFVQMIEAWKLEQSLSKNQILEIYINTVDFRGEYRGLRSASRAFFRKNPEGLDSAESSILVAMIRSPNARWEKVQARACQLDSEDCSLIGQKILNLNQDPSRVLAFENKAPHFTRWIWSQASSADKATDNITTSLDAELQDFVNQSLRSQVLLLQDQNVHDGAVLVLDNRTGQVLAYVGSSGDFSSAALVDGVQAKRQVGSTLKPFLYGTAFQRKILTPESWIEDSPVQIVFPTGVYRPQNHDKVFRGWVQARTALASSLNVPAVKVFKMIDDDGFWKTLSRMHLANLKDPDLYGPALALGVADLSLWDLTNAYRTLANKGEWSPAQWRPEANSQNFERVLSEDAVSKVSQILSSAQDRNMSFGYETSLATRFPAAAKTGTSKDMRDNWCLGFSKDYTVGVWVGNFNGEPMWNVLGVDGAGPLWNKVLTWLHENRRSQSSPAQVSPSSLVKSFSKPTPYPVPKITYPLTGMALAMDPDIPLKNQKIPLLVEGPLDRKTYWALDGKYWGLADKAQAWPLKKGNHRFDLKREEQILDTAIIEVR